MPAEQGLFWAARGGKRAGQGMTKGGWSHGQNGSRRGEEPWPTSYAGSTPQPLGCMASIQATAACLDLCLLSSECRSEQPHWVAGTYSWVRGQISPCPPESPAVCCPACSDADGSHSLSASPSPWDCYEAERGRVGNAGIDQGLIVLLSAWRRYSGTTT